MVGNDTGQGGGRQGSQGQPALSTFNVAEVYPMVPLKGYMEERDRKANGRRREKGGARFLSPSSSSPWPSLQFYLACLKSKIHHFKMWQQSSHSALCLLRVVFSMHVYPSPAGCARGDRVFLSSQSGTGALSMSVLSFSGHHIAQINERKTEWLNTHPCRNIKCIRSNFLVLIFLKCTQLLAGRCAFYVL